MVLHPAQSDFYPRPPRGGRLLVRVKVVRIIQFLSTPSARRATVIRHGPLEHGIISIHALREEGDFFVFRKLLPAFISIHALREEGDQCYLW